MSYCSLKKRQKRRREFTHMRRQCRGIAWFLFTANLKQNKPLCFMCLCWIEALLLNRQQWGGHRVSSELHLIFDSQKWLQFFSIYFDPFIFDCPSMHEIQLHTINYTPRENRTTIISLFDLLWLCCLCLLQADGSEPDSVWAGCAHPFRARSNSGWRRYLFILCCQWKIITLCFLSSAGSWMCLYLCRICVLQRPASEFCKPSCFFKLLCKSFF